MKLPIPGKPVRGSKTGVHIMALFDLLGRCWAMGIIWQLHNSPCTFRVLQERCGNLSPSTLNKRLKELTAAFIVKRTVEGYTLTASGEELIELLRPMGMWSKNWAKRFLDK